MSIYFDSVIQSLKHNYDNSLVSKHHYYYYPLYEFLKILSVKTNSQKLTFENVLNLLENPDELFRVIGIDTETFKSNIIEAFTVLDYDLKRKKHIYDEYAKQSFKPYIKIETERDKVYSMSSAMGFKNLKEIRLDNDIINKTLSEQIEIVRNTVKKKFNTGYYWSNFERLGNITSVKYYFAYYDYIDIFFEDLIAVNYEQPIGCCILGKS